MNKKNTGIMVISLDFELQYGMEDVSWLESYKSNILQGRNAISKILSLFQKYDIHATWAVVGMMMAEDKKELIRYIPESKPQYENRRLSIYNNFEIIGENEKEDPYHFGLSIVKKIKTIPFQEIGTHTFSHYYCLEKGQDIDTFKADLEKAVEIIKNKIDTSCESIVMPRNQINSQYVEVIRQKGIRAYRGCPDCYIYKTEKNYYWIRFFRLLDFYTNIFGKKIYSRSELKKKGICDVRASIFLRPYSKKLERLEALKIWNIKSQMTQAAKQGKIFHLWWHPHNFGNNMEKNLYELQVILEHYNYLRSEYGFQSKTMKEVADEIL